MKRTLVIVMRTLVIAMGLLFLAGCATVYEKDGGMTQREMDEAACHVEAARASAGLGGLIGAATYYEVLRNCMRAKGYREKA